MSKADDNRKTQSVPNTQAVPARPAAEEMRWEDAVREAFDSIKAPDDVRSAALAAIESRRAQASATRRKPRFRVVRRALAAAACVLAVAAGVVGFRLYNDPAAYVGIDINPSLELSVNMFGTVVDARALNEDADAVLQDVKVEGASYEDALSMLLGSEALSTYIDNDAYVEVGVTTDDDALASRLRDASDVCLQNASCEGSCHRVEAETRESAHHAGMGVGKYAAAQRLMELDSSVTLDECSDMSMRELRDRIDACGGDSAEGHRGDGSNGSSHSGTSQNAASGDRGAQGRGEAKGAQDGNGNHYGRSE